MYLLHLLTVLKAIRLLQLPQVLSSLQHQLSCRAQLDASRNSESPSTKLSAEIGIGHRCAEINCQDASEVRCTAVPYLSEVRGTHSVSRR